MTTATHTLTGIEHALRACWAADTCSPDDVERAAWSPGNPAWGHCDITALVVHDLLGGDLVLGEVHLAGEQHGFHWWNRLPDGTEIDLTRDQFRLGQSVTAGRVVTRPAGRPRRRAEEYELLRRRVRARLAHSGPERPGEPVRGAFESDDGHRLSYLDFGGPGRPLLALHGHFCETRTFTTPPRTDSRARYGSSSVRSRPEPCGRGPRRRPAGPGVGRPGGGQWSAGSALGPRAALE